DQQIDGVTDQQQAQQHSRQAAFQQKIHPDAGQSADQRERNDEGRHRAVASAGRRVISTSTRAPRLRSTSSTRPTTIRYTPRSKNRAVTSLMWPSTGTSNSSTADDSTGAPSNSEATAVPADSARPVPRILPASSGSVSPSAYGQPARYRGTNASPAVRPPAKPPPGVLWPAKKKYAESTMMSGKIILVATSSTSDRFRGSRV